MDRETRIRERAHAMWEVDGRPDGRHDDHWRRASDEYDSREPRDEAEASIRIDMAQRNVDEEAGLPSGEPRTGETGDTAAVDVGRGTLDDEAPGDPRVAKAGRAVGLQSGGDATTPGSGETSPRRRTAR